jgi:GTPase SAR1 family protein
MIEKTKKLNVVSQEELTQIKVAMIGDSGSGKSSLVRQLQKVPFCSSHESTLGVDTFHHYIEGKGCQTHLTFWDFSGKLDFIDIRN